MTIEQSRLESLDLAGLAGHTADELLDDVLTRAESKYSFRDFYHRWEHQHWLATEIDFTKDKEDWAALPEVVKETMMGPMMGFYQGEESVTRNLGPILAAAPRVEHEIFLSTQIVDEARHCVFFERFFNEVIGRSGTVEDHLALLRPEHGRWYSTLFFDDALGLDGRSAKLRESPDDIGLYAETITLYHFILEAGLALLGQRFLCDLCRGMDVLPGFYQGFMAITRDESRHVGGGVRIIRELRENDPSIERRVLDVMYESMPYAVRLVHPPERDYDMEMLQYIPEDYIQSPQESHRYSFTHILKRLTAAGFDAADVNKLGENAWTEFEKAIAEWEERAGAEHFARGFPDEHAKGPARIG